MKKRDKIRAIIFKYIGNGLNDKEIAAALNKRGVKTIMGTEYKPINIKRFRDLMDTKSTEPKRDDSEVIIDLILKSDLDDSRKVTLIKNLWGTPA